MLDNAMNNDTCVALLCENLFPEAPSDYWKQRRLRCTGHIINLAAKALFFGVDDAAFEYEAEAAHIAQNELLELAIWRRKGPVGKLHNMAHHVRRTPQQINAFAGLEL